MQSVSKQTLRCPVVCMQPTLAPETDMSETGKTVDTADCTAKTFDGCSDVTTI